MPDNEHAGQRRKRYHAIGHDKECRAFHVSTFREVAPEFHDNIRHEAFACAMSPGDVPDRDYACDRDNVRYLAPTRPRGLQSAVKPESDLRRRAALYSRGRYDLRSAERTTHTTKTALCGAPGTRPR